MAKYNPFNPNSVVEPVLFAGRSEQVLDICKKLQQLKHNMPASFFIYGERGIGKTALAKLIRYVASKNDPILYELNLLPSYYSVEKNQDISSVLQESLNKLADQMDKSLIDKLGGRLGEIFKNGKFQIGAFGTSIGVETSISQAEKNITVKDQTVAILSNIIKAIDEESENKKGGVFIIIDEIHNLRDIEGSASILRSIITSLDVENLGKISFMIIGYKEDMEKFFSEDSSSMRTFDSIELDVMPPTEAQDVLTKGFKAAEIKWDENALKKNILAAGGYPHSIQVVGHKLIDTDKDDNVDEKDWSDAIMNTAVDLQSKEFSTMYTFRKPLTERDRLLVCLAEQNKPLSKKEIGQITEVKNVYQHIPKLRTIGAIKETDDGKVYLQSQLLRTAILMDTSIRKFLELYKSEASTLPVKLS